MAILLIIFSLTFLFFYQLWQMYKLELSVPRRLLQKRMPTNDECDAPKTPVISIASQPPDDVNTDNEEDRLFSEKFNSYKQWQTETLSKVASIVEQTSRPQETKAFDNDR